MKVILVVIAELFLVVKFGRKCRICCDSLIFYIIQQARLTAFRDFFFIMRKKNSDADKGVNVQLSAFKALAYL